MTDNIFNTQDLEPTDIAERNSREHPEVTAFHARKGSRNRGADFFDYLNSIPHTLDQPTATQIEMRYLTQWEKDNPIQASKNFYENHMIVDRF